MAWQYEIGVAKYFTTSQQENNALEFYNYFRNYDITLEALCGILGNISKESTLNPGIKQGSSTSLGWGLIQWTPSTTLTDWCNTYGLTWYDGNAQCQRIVAEGERTMEASGYWLPTSAYPYSWREFCHLTDVHEATIAYLKERERAGIEDLPTRYQWADYWYEFLGGEEPPEPPPPVPPTPTKRKGMPVWMMVRYY